MDSAVATSSSSTSTAGPNVVPTSSIHTFPSLRSISSELSHAASSSPPVVCGTCNFSGDTKEALWMCLICGHCGCGRYHSSHAITHYQKTGHRYTLELNNQFIWDYEGDGYVHRLRRVEPDEELDRVSSYDDLHTVSGAAGASASSVTTTATFEDSKGATPHRAAPSSATASSSTKRIDDDYDDGPSADMDSDSDDERVAEEQELIGSKVQSITSYYNKLLNEQLQQQSVYFENKIADEDSDLTERVVQLQLVKESTAKDADEITKKITELDRQVKQAAAKRIQLQAKCKKGRESVDFLSSVNENIHPTDEVQAAIAQKRAQHEQALAKVLKEKNLVITGLKKKIEELMKALGDGA